MSELQLWSPESGVASLPSSSHLNRASESPMLQQQRSKRQVEQQGLEQRQQAWTGSVVPLCPLRAAKVQLKSAAKIPTVIFKSKYLFPSKLTAKCNWSKSIPTWYDIMIYNNMANWLLYCKFIVLRSTASVGSVGDELWECLLWLVMRQSVIEPHQLTFLYFWQVRKILWPV